MKNLRILARLVFSYIAANQRLFLAGLTVGILALIFLPRLLPYVLKPRPERIGVVGNYTVSNLPRFIQEEISLGLVRVEPSGLATPGAALSWQATDSGKLLIFNLDTSLSWQDGTKLTASDVNYNLKGVSISRPNDSQVEFHLPEAFAPLPILLSQPLFKNGLVGLGENKAAAVSFNGRFLASIELVNRQSGERKIYRFYPSEEALVTALKLGAVSQARDLHEKLTTSEARYLSTEEISNFLIATVFFNTQRGKTGEKTFRQGLIYALPDSFAEGETVDAPIPRNHWTKTTLAKIYPQNLNTAKKMLSPGASPAGKNLTLATIKELRSVAKTVASAWTQAGVPTSISVTELPPQGFDAYLTYLTVPADPDQYLLWHSTQVGNLSGYKSPKIDKLLEEGRASLELTVRKDIYAQFQKAITEDTPAAFLFYPRLYTYTRR